MAYVKESEREFKQEELPAVSPTLQPPAIQPVHDGANTTLSQGGFISPNYASGRRGWRLNSNGDAEFQSVKLARGFGGSGVDGALDISSGTTTINLGGAQVVTKNYTYISVTGTASIAFSNPHANGTSVLFLSQGDVTITTSTNPAIDFRSLGASGGAGGVATGAETQGGRNGGGGASMTTSGGSASDGSANDTQVNGTVGNSATWVGTSTGGGGGLSNAINAAGGVTVGYVGSVSQYVRYLVLSGSGGGGGSSGQSSSSGGAGGRGGGGFWLECGGALNFTSTLNLVGAAGVAGGGLAGGAGGGGGGGSAIMLYNLLTANTGTITVTGGAAGTPTTGTAGAGANGFSLVAKNTYIV